MDLYKIRAELHQIPELGRCEYKTKQYIVDFAKNLNCQVIEVNATGVILVFNAHKLHTICFRADMDGLPIQEETGLSFSSKHSGLMHACGHDGHMTMLLGFAEWASNHINELENNVVCLFQPSEEDNAGANDILQSGILDELKIERIFGMHIWPNLEENQLFTMSKGMLATSGEVDIHIYGKSCHAANRNEGIDALLIAIKLINQFYEIADEIKEPHLINFGKLNAGTVRNAVAKEAHIQATMRAFDDMIFLKMKESLNNLIQRLEQEFKARIELTINAAYPSVLNNEAMVYEYQDILNYKILDKPYLQAEDFGCYTRKYKSLFMLLGCGNKYLLHTNNFNFNTQILNKGIDAYKLISKHKI